MPNKRLNYVPGLLNQTNLPTPNAFTEPITGLPIPGSGLVLGDVMSITLPEATQLAKQPGQPSPFPLYEGDYQFVRVSPTANVANVIRGKVAYLQSVNPPNNRVVTDGSGAPGQNLITGIFINPITPGNYGWVQIGGRASVYMAAAGGSPGDPVIAVVASSAGTGAPAITAAQLPQLLGFLLVAATAVGGMAQVKLQLVNAQQ